MLKEYGVYATFNVIDLTPFTCSTNDEVETIDLRTDPLQEGEDDGRAPNKGQNTRSLARKCKKSGT